MMAGGDLDGDMFFVCWDESLIPPAMVEPGDYSADILIPAPRRQSKLDDPTQSITNRSIEFFIKYNMENELGLITTLW